MSQLEDLLLNSKSAGRVGSTMNAVPARSVNDFSGRSNSFTTLDKSDSDPAIQQSVAVNFIANTYQTGFNVNKNVGTLSINGFRKTAGVFNLQSDFTGASSTDSATPLAAFSTYARFVSDPFRNSIGTLIQRYNAISSKFADVNSTTAGITLGYTKPSNY